MQLKPLIWVLAATLPGMAQAVTCQNTIPPSNPDAIYTDHGNGTVTDTRTGLMWKQCLEGQSWDWVDRTCTGSATGMSWAVALSTAENATDAGHSDWRLPNIKELRSLVEECRTWPAINDTLFPGAPNSHVWSGSPSAGYTDYAWHVYFHTGHSDGYSRGYDGHVRLVRAGQSFDPLPALSAVAASGTPTSTSAAFVGTSDKTGTGYWLVVPSGSQAPTPAQVKAGVNYGSVIPVAIGSGAMIAGASTSFTASGLSAATGYDFYLVAEAGGQLSAPPAKVQFTSAALPVYPITANASPTAGGSVTCSPASVTHGGSSTCTATPVPGWQFDAWTGACAGQLASCTLSNVTKAKSVTGQFIQNSVALALPEGPWTGQTFRVTPSHVNGWVLDSASATTLSSVAAALPSGWQAPYGVVNLRLIQGTAGTQATVMLSYPQNLPPGTRYYKYGPTTDDPTPHWYVFDAAVISGNTITLTLTDGGTGDDDLSANSVIVDPGGPAVPAAGPTGTPVAVPTLSEWAMLLMAGLLGLLGAGVLRGRAAA